MRRQGFKSLSLEEQQWVMLDQVFSLCLYCFLIFTGHVFFLFDFFLYSCLLGWFVRRIV
jgi:hypothetical protein